MEIFKNIKDTITPTCIKETLERKNKLGIKETEVDREKMIKIPKTEEYQPNIPTHEVTAPYPKIIDASPNRADVKQLKKLATGADGELTATLTYLYQHYILSENYREIAVELEKIAQNEMTHYELLSEAIVDFGGDPNLTNGIGDIWTARNVNTEKNVRRILQDNIKGEEEAIIDYTRAAKQTSNESLAQLYLRIVEDERRHAETFKELLRGIQTQS
jgi:bacterioferritin